MVSPEHLIVAPFYHPYIAKLTSDSLQEAMEKHVSEVQTFLNNIPAEKWDHSYARGKWTIKEVVQHLLDSERVFSYRALRIARKDPTPLPGFDENLFADNSNAASRTYKEIIDEFYLVRQSTLALFKSFSHEQLQRVGVANEQPVSVEATGFVIAGHCLHHIKVMEERYLA